MSAPAVAAICNGVADGYIVYNICMCVCVRACAGGAEGELDLVVAGNSPAPAPKKGNVGIQLKCEPIAYSAAFENPL